MALNEEIKQNKDISDYERGIVNILLSYYYVENELSEVLAGFDVTLHQYNILRILRGRHPDSYTNNNIRERMLHKSADATRLINRMAKKKLVSREKSPEDRRKVQIKVTERGLYTLKQIDNKMGDIEKILASLSTPEVRSLNHLLEKLRS